MASTTILSDNGVSSGSAGIKTTGGNDGTLLLQTTTAGGAATTAVTIDTSQNVGIGTSSPSGKLHVLSGTSPNLAGVLVGYNATSVNYYDANTQIFRDGGATERARIDSSGNLLVGTTSYSNGQDAVALNPVSRYFSRSSTGSQYQIVFANPNGTIGRIETNGSSTSFVTSSDYRLKENIAPMTGALSVVQQLNPVTYNWKADGSDGQGFIAHELQAVVPDCVTGKKDAVDADGNPVYQGIDTSFLVATLTAAIQELNAKFEAYKEAHP
jgi:hypothetical protein